MPPCECTCALTAGVDLDAGGDQLTQLPHDAGGDTVTFELGGELLYQVGPDL